MVGSLQTSVMAESVIPFEQLKAAEMCLELGLILGNGGGVDAEYLKSDATRIQSAVIMLRLMGLEEDMLEFDYIGKDNFADAYGSEYTEQLGAYLKAHPELGWIGDGNNHLNPIKPLTAKELTKVLLEALGYQQGIDFAWEEVFTFAQDRGLMLYDFYSDKDLNVADTCELIADTLERLTKNQTVFVQELIDIGVVESSVAEFYELVRGDLKLEYIDTLSNNHIRLYFNVPIDEITVDAIIIENLVIKKVEIKEDGLTADVTVLGAVVNESYNCRVEGAKFGNVIQSDTSLQFTFLGRDVYEATISFKDETREVGFIESDGNSSVVTFFTLRDIDGLIYGENSEVEVAFTTNFGSFAEERVTVQDGVATNLLTSEYLTEEQYAIVTARIIEADDDRLIGMEAKGYILLTPHPENYDNLRNGEMILAEANEADRVIVFFDDPIHLEDYTLTEGEMERLGTISNIDTTAVDIEVRRSSTYLDNGEEVAVLGLLPLHDDMGNLIPDAIQILLDVNNRIDENGTDPGDPLTDNWLIDNSDVYVSFEDLLVPGGDLSQWTFKFTDVRDPSLLSVKTLSPYKLEVIFSEAVIKGSVVGSEEANAELLNNWSINGTILSDPMWNASVEVQYYDVAKSEDMRHKAIITLGDDIHANQIFFDSGEHSIQASTIGDWAYISDKKNMINTQTLDFEIEESFDLPRAYVEVLSPETYLLTFDAPLAEDIDDLREHVAIQVYNDQVGSWQTYQKPLLDGPLDNDILNFMMEEVLGAETSTYVIQSDLDWSVHYDTANSNKNYFNDMYRIVIDGDSATSLYNGLTNDVIVLPLGDAMLEPDVFSPAIESVVANVSNSKHFDVLFTEPVKISSALNSESATVSQEQSYQSAEDILVEAWDDLPEPTVEFIRSDYSESITGTITSIDELDMTITVEPDQTLGLGSWMMVVRSISDDIGNTTNSVAYAFEVTEEEFTYGDLAIEWAFADVDVDLVVEDIDLVESDFISSYHDGLAYDYVFVKFNQPVSTTGDYKNALKTSNYTLDGVSLPSGTSIVANIIGYDDFDNIVDSITIRLPQGYLEDKNNQHILNLSHSIESVEGTALGARGGERSLPYVGHDWSTAPGAMDTLDEQLDAEDFVAGLIYNSELDYMDMITADYTWNELATYAVANQEALTFANGLHDSSIMKPFYIDFLEMRKAEVANLVVSNNYFTLVQGATPTQVAAICGSDGAVETDFTILGLYFDFETVTTTGSDVILETAGTGTLGATTTVDGDGVDDVVIVTIEFIPLGVESSINVTVADPSVLNDDVIVDPNNSVNTRTSE